MYKQKKLKESNPQSESVLTINSQITTQDDQKDSSADILTEESQDYESKIFQSSDLAKVKFYLTDEHIDLGRKEMTSNGQADKYRRKQKKLLSEKIKRNMSIDISEINVK
jgi:hypothetical protein